MSDLGWTDNSVPISTRFDDPYYSKEDGRAETSHVFINGNRLGVRWPTMRQCTIGELGFGTGLNFLETVHQWQRHRARTSTLRFISFEQFPISAASMQRALSHWPELSGLATKLVQAWRTHEGGIELEFEECVYLTVHFGDANTELPKQSFLADAWYLDGFSPAKNPQLWNANLMKEVAKHTVAGGTFSSYTSAGHVRRSLEEAGFSVRKSRGFGRKREMITGEYPSDIDVAKGH